MLKYLVILLDDTAVSYCHYQSKKAERRLISLADLKAGILFAMKQNLMLQVVYPACEIPAAHREAIETIDHCKVAPVGGGSEKRADVVVLDGRNAAEGWAEVEVGKEKVAVLRLAKAEFFACYPKVGELLGCVGRINVVITDVEAFGEPDFQAYGEVLSALSVEVKKLYAQGLRPQLNILTDRLMLEAMNSCNAGYESVTLAPNGKFYVCPAFYMEDESEAIGDLFTGLSVKNRQLYGIQHAPLCRRCDAYQCKRCVWLNRKTTGEVNTPSREQCVAAHLERNASGKLLRDLQSAGGEHGFVKTIGDVSYLDPFDTLKDSCDV
ncbi:MAG: CXXX repeat peptide maturase [Prevotellaceae bacterium]|jgi:CXXX repeat peptide maturase|nr:CXXX repeat peptide maturase [Prevotellaceae bacterium]